VLLKGKVTSQAGQKTFGEKFKRKSIKTKPKWEKREKKRRRRNPHSAPNYGEEKKGESALSRSYEEGKGGLQIGVSIVKEITSS